MTTNLAKRWSRCKKMVEMHTLVLGLKTCDNSDVNLVNPELLYMEAGSLNLTTSLANPQPLYARAEYIVTSSLEGLEPLQMQEKYSL